MKLFLNCTKVDRENAHQEAGKNEAEDNDEENDEESQEKCWTIDTIQTVSNCIHQDNALYFFYIFLFHSIKERMLDEDAEDARRRRQRQKKQENNQADETNFVQELMGNMGGWNVAGMETPKKILNKLKHETQKKIRLIGSVLRQLHI